MFIKHVQLLLYFYKRLIMQEKNTLLLITVHFQTVKNRVTRGWKTACGIMPSPLHSAGHTLLSGELFRQVSEPSDQS